MSMCLHVLGAQVQGFHQSPKLRPPHMGSTTNPMQTLVFAQGKTTRSGFRENRRRNAASRLS
eukprot:4491531-Lingulodinium_polyedra.AAC.1